MARWDDTDPERTGTRLELAWAEYRRSIHEPDEEPFEPIEEYDVRGDR